MNARWMRRALALTAAVGVYALLGFFAVPWAARNQMERFGNERLQRRLEAGEVRFNPFTLRAEARAVKLEEADGTPLVFLGGVVVRMQWRSLLPGAWRFDEVSVTDPALAVVISKDGRLNFAELAKTLAASEEPQPAQRELPGIVIEHLAVQRGRIDMHDRQAGYANAFAPIDFDMEGFSTLANASDSYLFSAQWRNGGRLRWKGHASVNPLSAEGEVAIEGVSLRELGVYAKSRAGIDVSAGRLAATLPYSISHADGKLDAGLKHARVSIEALAAQQPSGPRLDVGNAQAQLDAHVSVHDGATDVRLSDAALVLQDVVAVHGGDAPIRLARAGFEGATLDLAARKVALARLYAQQAQLEVARDRSGIFNLARWATATRSPQGAQSEGANAPAWIVEAARVEASGFDVGVVDEASGIHTRVQNASAVLEGVKSGFEAPIAFQFAASLAQGGKIAAKGSVDARSGAVKSDVQVQELDLRPLQPLLEQYVKLKIRGGRVFAQGRVEAGGKQVLRYDGSFGIRQLALHEEDNDPFASWRDVSAPRMSFSLAPNRIEIPELNVTGADAKLIIEDDRTFNAARLLVARAAQAGASPAPAAAKPADPFPLRVRRVRVQDARVQFTDLSLRPQFSAKVYELAGVINGLSSSGNARSQIELDGRVDEFGLARVRGELNPFKPRDNTDVRVQFRNVDMVPASPYSMKFAGYRIAQGKISLDLQYKVRDSKLEGDNKIVIDELTLGERIDSPDALKIPLQLAIAILKDSDGRIDLGLPVSGDMDDPQFSYGAIVWKAIGNVLTKIVTAPFRALGALLGIEGDKLEAVTFDAGSSVLLPPDREKLKQVGQLMAKRSALKLSVPAGYSGDADAQALRVLAVRRDVSQRAGITVGAGEQPGPLDIGDRKVRTALRELYAQRFGEAELDKAKKAAESAPPAASASGAARSLPIWERAAKMVQGEPQVADSGAFYGALRQRLEREQPLAADALTKLGSDRAQAIVADLGQSGVDATRVAVSPPQAVESPVGQPVPLKLGLDAR